MEDIIIDPLHCLLLNLPKIAWKYTFGDRMTNEQRELVAEYLTSIGCPLDIRDKNDGRDANRKWFTGEVFQRFVEGDNLSPGLAENIKATMDIIYLKAPAPAKAPDPADKDVPPAPAAPEKNKTARQGGGGGKETKRGGQGRYSWTGLSCLDLSQGSHLNPSRCSHFDPSPPPAHVWCC